MRLKGVIVLIHYTCNFPRISCSLYKNRCVRSIIKGTILGEHCTFSAVSQASFQGFSWIFVSRSFTHVLQTLRVWLRSIIKSTLLWEQSILSAVTWLPQCREYSYLVHLTHELETMRVKAGFSRGVNDARELRWRHLTSRTPLPRLKIKHGLILPRQDRGLLTSHARSTTQRSGPRKCDSRAQFTPRENLSLGYDRSVIQSTLLRKNFSGVSRIPLDGFSWKFIPRTLLACITNDGSFLAIVQ
jgi:hypothetical protein